MLLGKCWIEKTKVELLAQMYNAMFEGKRTLHTNTSSQPWLKNMICVLEWSTQRPDLNPIEMLWHNLKRAMRARHPRNTDELKHIRRKEWSKSPPH